MTKTLTAARKKALQVIQQDAGTLINDKNLAGEMAKALSEIVETIRENPSCRWGRRPFREPENLASIVKSRINPVMKKILIHWDTPATSFPMYGKLLTPESKSPEILELEKLIRDFYCTGVSPDSPEKNALDLLLRSLQILRAQFSPDPKTVHKYGDQPFCKYCYREISQSHDPHIERDTCHQHRDKNGRESGQAREKEYVAIRKFLNKIPDRSLRHYFGLTLHDLHNNPSVGAWSGKQDDVEWIARLLKYLDVCQPFRISVLADEIAKQSIQYQKELHKAAELETEMLQESKNEYVEFFSDNYYPSSLYGTLLRHEATLLAYMRTPDKKVAASLSRIWAGDKQNAVAINKSDESSISQRKKHWNTKIQELRKQSVHDEVIKFVFGFSALPAKD